MALTFLLKVFHLKLVGTPCSSQKLKKMRLFVLIFKQSEVDQDSHYQNYEVQTAAVVGDNAVVVVGPAAYNDLKELEDGLRLSRRFHHISTQVSLVVCHNSLANNDSHASKSPQMAPASALMALPLLFPPFLA